MRELLNEYGGFIVEVISGIAVIATLAIMWPIIRSIADKIAFMLV